MQPRGCASQSVAGSTLTSEASTVLPSVGARSLVTGDRQSASLDARKYKENSSPGLVARASWYLYCLPYSAASEGGEM